MFKEAHVLRRRKSSLCHEINVSVVNNEPNIHSNFLALLKYTVDVAWRAFKRDQIVLKKAVLLFVLS